MHRHAALATTEWDEVWAEYDARVDREAPPAAPAAVVRPAMRRRPVWLRRGQLAVLVVGMVAVAGSAWVGAHGAALWQVAEAVERQDAAAIARHFDAAAVQATMRENLMRIVARQEGTHGTAYLNGMAEEMVQAWSDVTALSEFARVRRVAVGSATDGLAGIRPVGLSAVEMPVATNTSAAMPMTLRLELRNIGLAPQWRLTGVGMGDTAPPAAPAPVWISALR
jgi:hypothetical protein